jgi:hypothetical protein
MDLYLNRSAAREPGTTRTASSPPFIDATPASVSGVVGLRLPAVPSPLPSVFGDLLADGAA